MATACYLMSACGKDEKAGWASLTVYPSEKYNAKIHYVSKLTDAPIATSEAQYTAINNYFTNTLKKREGSWLGVIDRSDVTYTTANMFGGAVKTIFDSRHWSGYAHNRITGNGTKFEGSTLLLNNHQPQVTTKKLSDDCYITEVTPTMSGTSAENGASTAVSFDINFRTVRFETEAEVSAFGGPSGVMNKMKLEKMSMLMIGTVKKGLVGALTAAVQSADPSFKFQIMAPTQDAAYNIFMLCEERFWGFTGCNVTSLGDGINVYTIDVMW